MPIKFLGIGRKDNAADDQSESTREEKQAKEKPTKRDEKFAKKYEEARNKREAS